MHTFYQVPTVNIRSTRSACSTGYEMTSQQELVAVAIYASTTKLCGDDLSIFSKRGYVSNICTLFVVK